MNGKQVRLYAAILHSNKMLLVCPDPLRLCKLAAVRLGGLMIYARVTNWVVIEKATHMLHGSSGSAARPRWSKFGKPGRRGPAAGRNIPGAAWSIVCFQPVLPEAEKKQKLHSLSTTDNDNAGKCWWEDISSIVLSRTIYPLSWRVYKSLSKCIDVFVY